jgi:hypothetical protein
MNFNTIVDLNRTEQPVSSLLTSNERQQGYQPKTLQQYNSTRSIYLPIFPTKSFGANDHLLLANVPGSFFHNIFVYNKSSHFVIVII